MAGTKLLAAFFPVNTSRSKQHFETLEEVVAQWPESETRICRWSATAKPGDAITLVDGFLIYLNVHGWMETMVFTPPGKGT